MSNTSSAAARGKSIPRAAFHTVEADGVRVFYREAGPADAPVLLPLHGYPASSHMFRELIPRMATNYRVIAPDLPGFGFTTVPAERDYKYSFDALAHSAEAFVDALGLKKYALYIFDYGAPVGLRWRTRNELRRSYRRMATRMKRDWAMRGIRFRDIGRRHRHRIAKRCAARC